MKRCPLFVENHAEEFQKWNTLSRSEKNAIIKKLCVYVDSGSIASVLRLLHVTRKK
jgi:hypothetical protein